MSTFINLSVDNHVSINTTTKQEALSLILTYAYL